MSKLPRSTFFYAKGKDGLDKKNGDLIELIKAIFFENKKRYGYRRITLALKNEHSLTVNHKKVKRIMKKEGLFPPVGRSKYRSYKGEVGKAAPNVIGRDFKADRPNRKWTTDVTEFHFPWGKVYLSPILDMFSGEIISYSVSRHPSYSQTTDMPNKAFGKSRNLRGLILHSDQGWQYQMSNYQNRLSELGIIQSMSRKGNCLDNSIMENFFGLMKKEMFFDHQFEFGDYGQFKKAIDKYIYWYNNKRIKTKLKGLSPVQYRIQSLQQPA